MYYYSFKVRTTKINKQHEMTKMLDIIAIILFFISLVVNISIICNVRRNVESDMIDVSESNK